MIIMGCIDEYWKKHKVLVSDNTNKDVELFIYFFLRLSKGEYH